MSAEIPPDTSDALLRREIRSLYAQTATQVREQSAASCCPASGRGDQEGFGAGLYADEYRNELPQSARTASLGCGNPLQVAEPLEGETVLDLGSGGGIDVLLSARRVGPTGTAYGLDMTEEMIQLARTNAAKAGATNVEFLNTRMEEIPLPTNSVDVVMSNCVINLSADKQAVLAESFRVLRSGGRFGITDIVADDDLDAPARAERGSYVGCVAGALSFEEHRQILADVGFTGIEITPTHQVADGMHSAIIRALKEVELSGSG